MKKKTDQAENTAGDSVNPFEPDMSLGNPEFKLADLLEQCKVKLAEQDKRKIGIQERIVKAKESIIRIQNMIQGLELKSSQESGQAWVNVVIRPLMAELQKVFPNAVIDMSTVLSGAVTVTVCRKGVTQADKLKNQECKAVTFIPAENGLSVRDYSKDTGEYPAGSIGAIAGLNNPVVAVSPDAPVQFIVDWLLQ